MSLAETNTETNTPPAVPDGAAADERQQSVDMSPEDHGRYMDALLARVATLDGGDALAVVLRSILAELAHLHTFADDTADTIQGFGETLGAIGKGGLGGMLGLLRGQ